MEQQKYDVIVIGSGIGGLTCGSLLAQLENKKVLILERHSKAGGFTHTFKRETKYEWDVGLHYIGHMHRGSETRAFFDFITSGKVIWNRMPDPYDVFIYPGLKFTVRSGKENVRQEVCAQFPHERQALDTYFRDLQKVSNWSARFAMAGALPSGLKFISPLLTAWNSGLALWTTGKYLQKNFKDPRLRAVLASQWGTYGLPPGMSSFLIHAIIVNHYMDGGYYPADGSKSIADSIVPSIENSGGKVLLNHQVTGIIIKNGKAIGVKCVKRKSDDTAVNEFYADHIVSDTGAWITYGQLLPADYQHPYIGQVKAFPPIAGNVTLYVGFKSDPRLSLPVQGENYWIYSGFDHDDLYARRNELLQGKANMAFLSFPSLKKSEARHHTAEIISFVDYEPFKIWADQPLKKRDAAYQQLKERISRTLLEMVEVHLPGFQSQVAYTELSTPLTTEHYTGHREGNIYGIPAMPSRFRRPWIGVRTPVKNLYLTGSDAAVHGISGAMMGGVLTAAVLLGFPRSMMKIFKTAIRYSKGLSA